MNYRSPKSVDKLPKNPLRMPPPYWRTGGACFQINDALSVLVQLLKSLPEINNRTKRKLDDFYRRHPNERAARPDRVEREFGNIIEELWELEHKIRLKTEIVILMTAIQSEELINKFCVFNLQREIAETLEHLAPKEKLTAAASSLGRRNVRSTPAYGAVKELMDWRNAYAHGHCTDRPLKSLRHNHLISPDEYPGVPDSISLMLKLTAGYQRLSDYLTRISINRYTRGIDTEWLLTTKRLRVVERYKFSGSHDVYEVIYV
jgi:hypothetical protein